MSLLTCFKAYDIRGRLGEELNEDIAYRIGRALSEHLSAASVVVGADVRLSSETLKQALSRGILDSGADVIDLGMTGTEQIYHAAQVLPVDAGVEVTASHNPMDYNGLKLVKAGARPISGDTGLKAIRQLAEANAFTPVNREGRLTRRDLTTEFVDTLFGFIEPKNLKPQKLVINSGNGSAGPVVDAIEQRLAQLNAPLTLIKVHHAPDGTFPNGIPNPLLPERRQATAEAVIEHQADFGVAFDGDFDRCFFFDEHGEFIEGYYLVGLLAEAFLAKNPGANIIHDPRLTWNTIDVVSRAGGVPVQSKTGHAFIKERMRLEDAVYGGEMSAHHYFRDFAYCDSGMIPWLLVAELLSVKGISLGQAVSARLEKFPTSGEINVELADAGRVIKAIEQRYQAHALTVEHTDGLSMEFPDWRFNLRMSNTEPLVRLNVEARGNAELMRRECEKLLAQLG